MTADSDDIIEPSKKIFSIHQLSVGGTLLFFDQLLIAAAGWVFWLVVVSKITSFEVGQAITVYSLTNLISTISQLGLEYPLLKRSSNQRSQILMTVIVIELLFTLISIPLVFYVINNVFQESSPGIAKFTWLAIAILILSSFSFVSRFGLLGISDVKSILVIDVIGTGIKFLTGYALVLFGFGAFGILMSFLLQNVIIIAAAFVVIRRRAFGLRLGSRKYATDIVREGLVNAPPKFSRIIIVSLSVVLLASLGISSTEIGTFYVALVVSIVAAGGLASSIAYMVIPASAASKIDLSSSGARIGVTMTAPLIAALIASPKFILSIIGTQYVSGHTILLILSIAILPSTITMNAISRFNNLDQSKKLISIGCLEFLTFILTFIVLVYYFGTIGASFSILLAFIGSSILSMIWLERTAIRYFANAAAAVFGGAICGYVIGAVAGTNPIGAVVSSILVSSAILVMLKNTSFKEIRQIARGIFSRK